jgi:hypothetical protein
MMPILIISNQNEGKTMYKKIRHKTTSQIFTIKLDDQLPRLGSGHRHVEMIKMGRKWVKLRTYLGNPKKVDKRLLDNFRILKTEWDKIPKNNLN